MEFPINRELVESTTRIKEERRVVRERLHKIDESRSSVSPTVYARVRTDYETKLHEITTQLLAKKHDVDRELATLYEARSQVEQHVAEQKEHFEEVQFRHSLGEHDEAIFQEQANMIGDKLAKFEAVLAGITGNINRYESLLADEHLSETTPGAAPVGSLPPTPAKTVQAGLTTAPLPNDVTDDPDDTPPETPLSALLDPEPENSAATQPEASGSYRLDDGDYFGGPINETQLLNTGATDGDTAVGPMPTAHSGVLRLLQGGTGHEIFPLVDETTIGRSTGNVVVLREAKVSRQHAIIRRTGNHWTIEDLQSSNGVLINGAQVTDGALQDGDEIQIGDFVLKIELA